MMSGTDQLPDNPEASASIAAEPIRRRRYTLDELLAKCDPTAPAPKIDQPWMEGAPVGSEFI
jgi:antitoxin component of MazEF toxin-antitoxin module